MIPPKPEPASFPAAAQGISLMAVACPSCNAALAVAADVWGSAAACPLCQTHFTLPHPPLARPSAADSATLSRSLQETSLETAVGAKPLAPDWSPAADAVDEQRRAASRRSSRRRSRRNAIMLFVGMAILLTIAIVLGRKSGR